MRLRSTLLVLSAALVLAASAPFAGAQGAPATDPPAVDPADVPEFAVFPAGPEASRRPRFEYRLQATQTLGDVVSVANLGDVPLTVALYATDAINTPDGGFSLLEQSQPPDDVGSWVTLASSSEVVQPGTQIDVPFDLAIPADASPGDHVGGIVAQASPVDSGDGGDVGVDVIQRVGARLYLTVDGPTAPHLDVEAIRFERDGSLDPTSGSATVTYTVRNSGNVRLSGRAAVGLSGVFGTDLGAAPEVDVPELLPGSSMEFEATFDDVPAALRVTAEVRLDAVSGRSDVGDPGTVVRSASVWAVPWLAVALVIVAIVGLVAMRRRRRVRRRRDEAREREVVSVAAKPRRETVDA